MNISFAYLTLSSLTNSPILSYPILSHHSATVFNHIHISNLFSTFYYRSSLIQSSAQKKSSHFFLNSVFDHLLNRAIEIESSNILSYQVPLGRSIFSLDYTHVDNCIFKHISNPSNFGGALMTFSGLEIQNSLFLQCFALEGGALSCHEDFSMLHVTFQNCNSKSQSGTFDRRAGSEKYKCDIELCTFYRCRSEYFGAFYNLNQRGSFDMKYNNISQITASQCVGCFEVCGSLSNFKFMIISECSANVHNGCIVMRGPKSLKFDYCLFYECSHSSFVSDAGAVLLCYDNPSDSIISNCFFIFNKPSDSYTLTVSNGFGKLKILNTFFTGNRNKEINNNGNILIDTPTVQFGYNCRSDIFDEIDFDKNENEENINRWKMVFKENLSDNTFGCLTINFKEHEGNNGAIDDVNVSDFIDDDDNPQDFFFIHFIAILLALVGAFLLQYLTNIFVRLYQSHKHSRESE
ncbi:hypothetical protein M9Y10_016367 [Tritrichomonas musculus]|uniref:Right handed beta helix domain-containing protein n=1 Tax=Tritrichomonas musculus TaxID=1915356 RepID=A0ABR2HVZ5_9EUKA